MNDETKVYRRIKKKENKRQNYIIKKIQSNKYNKHASNNLGK